MYEFLENTKSLTKPVFDLEVERTQGQKLRFVRNKVEFPWSLGRGFISDKNPYLIRILPQVVSGGLLSGDDLYQRLIIRKSACARLESSGATLVLPGYKGVATTKWEFCLEDNSVLIVDSEPYSLSEQASFEIYSEIKLAPTSVLINTENICFSSKEIKKCGSFLSEIKVFSNTGETILIDKQKADNSSFNRLSKLIDDQGAFGTIWIFAKSEFCEKLVDNLPVVDCLMAKSALRGRSGYAIRLLARNGGLLRNSTKLILSEIELRLAEIKRLQFKVNK